MDNFLGSALFSLLRGHLGHHATVKANVTWFALAVVLLKVGEFDGSNTKEDLDVSGETNRLDGAKNISVGELVAWEVDTGLLNNHTNNSKHADAAVLELSPACVLQISLDIGKSHRVKAHVTCHGAIELIGADQERDGLGHFLGIQRNRVSPLGRLSTTKKDCVRKMENSKIKTPSSKAIIRGKH
jgi:hypothetical protein